MTSEVAPVSEREAEVLAALGEHLTNAQIAARLHVSVRTVETHVSSLLRKLNAADRRGLAELAPNVRRDGHRASAVRGIPATWTPFVGRVRERGEVVGALSGGRLVTVLGPGGVGKTRLAAEVALELAPAFAFGAAFVELVGARTGFLVQTVASVLDVAERPGQALREAVIARLRPGRMLLVLDNCEHLIDEVADFVTALLGESDDLRVLTTSQARLGIPGERVVTLRGLSVVAEATGGAAGSDAVTLFLDRARMLDAGFDADPAAVGELCAQLDGLPLAIELATARSAALGIAGLRAGLADRLRLLSGGRGGDERHRSLRAVLDWSHDLLDPDEQAALHRLARFAGDFDIAAASAVVGLPLASVADVVGRLTDKSLLVHRRDGERWRLLETVRVYAVDKLAESGELPAVTERYVRWAIDASGHLERQLQDGEVWQGEFDAIADDLRAALDLAGGEVAAHLARSVGHLAFARRFLAEARRLYLRAAECTDDDGQAAHDLWSAAGVAQVESNGRLRYEYARAAAGRAAAAGDAGTQAAVLAEAVSVATRFPAIFDRDVGLAELQHMLRTAHDVAPPGDLAAQAQLVAADAWTETRVVDVPDEARFRSALAAAERAQDPLLVSAALDALVSAHQMRGGFAAAYELGVRRLGLVPSLPAHLPRAGSEIHDIVHMGVEMAVSAGRVAAALETSRLFADERLVAAAPHMVESKPVVPLLLLGDFDRLSAAAEAARQAWLDAGRPPARWMAPSVYAVVLCYGLRGDDAAAGEWRAFAREVAGDQTRNVHFQVGGMVQFVELRLALHRGRPDRAAELLAGVPSGTDAWTRVRHWYFDAYPWAVAAEFAAAMGLPDAPDRLAAAEPAAAENPWAAAVLARTRARISRSPEDLDAALDAWERLDARVERACTLALIPGREDEARIELDALGITLPAGLPR